MRTGVVPEDEDEFWGQGELESILVDVLVKLVVEQRVGILLPGHCFHREGLFFTVFLY